VIGLVVAAIVMIVYCVDLAGPLATGDGAQARDDNTERVGNVVLFGTVIFASVWGPTAAAVGGAVGVVAFTIRRKRLAGRGTGEGDADHPRALL
jgi:hypothetical protein